ncbi:MAG: RHS repeat-associated core domain-containing protein, partial [Parvularculaceae bacterium]
VLIQTNGVTTAASDYDAAGQRVSSTVAGATTHFIHDPYGRLIAEHDGSTGAVLREYVFLGLMPVAMIDYSGGSAVTYYLHTDQVMQPQVMTDAAGAPVWNRIADPFGVEVSASGSLTQKLRFPGQTAEASGLNQNWNRDYDPSLGRYIQSDPIGLMGGINTYAYVGGNPLTLIDPTGLEYKAPGTLGHGSASGDGIRFGRFVSDMPNGRIRCTCGSVPEGADVDFFQTVGFDWTKIIDGDVHILQTPYPERGDAFMGSGVTLPPRNHRRLDG